MEPYWVENFNFQLTFSEKSKLSSIFIHIFDQISLNDQGIEVWYFKVYISTKKQDLRTFADSRQSRMVFIVMFFNKLAENLCVWNSTSNNWTEKQKIIN